MHRLTWSILFLLVLASLRDARTQPLHRVLPDVVDGGGPGVWTVISMRRSTRQFSTRDLAEPDLGQLLWAGQGQLDNHRTTPSAGAIYPLTIHVVDHRGTWRYVPADHELLQEGALDRREELSVAALRQRPPHDAAATFVISGDASLVAAKYGPHNALRMMTLEAGHVAQNVLLAATALDLAAVPIGAFEERDLRRVLALPDNLTPLYLIAVGHRP